jgi:hypothetical protein
MSGWFAAARSTRTRGVRRLGLAVALLVLAATGACKKNRVEGLAPPPSLRADAGVAADSVRGKDDLWRSAIDGDDGDLARLADREGAQGLLDGLQEGDAIGVAALRALPFADDAEAAYERLGEIVKQIDSRQIGPVVRAIDAIASQLPAQTEPVDPAGRVSCARALLDLAKNKALAPAVRAQAISALRMLCEKHAIDRAAIPDDLDPK